MGPRRRPRRGRSWGDRWSGAPHCAAPPGSVSRRCGRRSVQRVIDFAPCLPARDRRSPSRSVASSLRRGRVRRRRAVADPADRAGRVGDPARGQHHHQGLRVPARGARPRGRRDRPAPRHQRRPRGPRGGHRRRLRPGRLGGRRGGDRRSSARPDPGRHRPARASPGCASWSAQASGWTSSGRCRPTGRPSATPWLVGCHIPGHWARGMQIPVRWVVPSAPARPRERVRWYALDLRRPGACASR